MVYMFFLPNPPRSPPPPAATSMSAPASERDVPRDASGQVQIGQFLAMQQKPKWLGTSSAVRQDLLKSKAAFPTHVLASHQTPGIPPAPISAYGSNEAVGQHAYQWDPHTTLGAHPLPDMHSLMINGRPMQVSSSLIC